MKEFHEIMDVVSAIKMGRVTCGQQKGQGNIRHAVDATVYNFGSTTKALCGTEPGRRSVGWAADPAITEITCKRCLAKIERLKCSVVATDK